MYYHIINDCDVQLWGVSQHDRIQKLMVKIGEFRQLDRLAARSATDKVLLIRADYLFDAKVLSKLTTHSQAILMDSSNKMVVAAWIDGSQSAEILPVLESQPTNSIKSIPSFTPQGLTGGYDPRLRKFDLSHVVKITASNQEMIENYMYDKSYKGITDFITKWWWPLPARWVVRKCVALKISPNLVTSFGWLLTIFSCFAFYYGHFAAGLASAWVMTFLDTVDGKLARVTLQSSKIGHAMDHGLDIFHPPVWYWCWAIGLQIEHLSFLGITWSVSNWFWCMFAAYVGGRVIEGLFQLAFNDISIFCWKPIDSYHRLITARRNPCLILLTTAVFMSNPALGFIWIVAWSMISTMWLTSRFTYACIVRLVKGPLESWIANIDPQQRAPSFSIRWFTGYQALKTIEPLIQSKREEMGSDSI